MAREQYSDPVLIPSCATAFASTSSALIFPVLLLSLAVSAARSGEVAAAETAIEARVTFNPDGRVVHIPLTFNQTKRDFIIDTGASVSIVDLSLRKELGTPLRTVELNPGQGNTRIELFKSPPAKFGARVLSGVTEVLCTDMSVVRDATGTRAVGVIGMDFLWQRIVRFDFDRGEVICLRTVPEDSGRPIPLGRAERGPEITLQIEGVGPLRFLIDTGCNGEGTIESAAFAALLQNAKATYVTSGLRRSPSGLSTSRAALVSAITVDLHRHRDLLFSESDMNRLGLGYLSRYVVTFDFARKQMYLRPGKTYNNSSRWNLSGSHFLRNDGQIVVSLVLPGSAAGRAGLRVDDVIESVDSRPTRGLTLWDVCQPLWEPGKHTLRVVRGTKTIDLSLLLERPKVMAAASSAARGGEIQNREK